MSDCNNDFVYLLLKGELFEETIQLEIYEELRLTQPPTVAEKDFSGLLIAPETQMQLRSNRDGLSRVSYRYYFPYFEINLINYLHYVIYIYTVLLFFSPSLQGHPTSTNMDTNIRDPSTNTAWTEQNSILTLSNNGLLTTQTSSGRAAVVISAIDETNVRQTLGLSVEVHLFFVFRMFS